MWFGPEKNRTVVVILAVLLLVEQVIVLAVLWLADIAKGDLEVSPTVRKLARRVGMVPATDLQDWNNALHVVMSNWRDSEFLAMLRNSGIELMAVEDYARLVESDRDPLHNSRLEDQLKQAGYTTIKQAILEKMRADLATLEQYDVRDPEKAKRYLSSQSKIVSDLVIVMLGAEKFGAGDRKRLQQALKVPTSTQTVTAPTVSQIVSALDSEPNEAFDEAAIRRVVTNVGELRDRLNTGLNRYDLEIRRVQKRDFFDDDSDNEPFDFEKPEIEEEESEEPKSRVPLWLVVVLFLFVVGVLGVVAAVLFVQPQVGNIQPLQATVELIPERAATEEVEVIVPEAQATVSALCQAVPDHPTCK